jgi:hypothetical protein
MGQSSGKSKRNPREMGIEATKNRTVTIQLASGQLSQFADGKDPPFSSSVNPLFLWPIFHSYVSLPEGNHSSTIMMEWTNKIYGNVRSPGL